MTTENTITPKKLLTAIVAKFVETNTDLVPLFGPEVANQIAEFYSKMRSSKIRGLPAVERLAMIEGLLSDHYAQMPEVGSPNFANWQYESFKLLQRKERVEREIKEGSAHPEPKRTRKAKA